MATPHNLNGAGELLRSTTLGRELLAEAEGDALAARQALVAEIERVESEAATQRQDLQQRFDQAEARFAELEAELQAAKTERYRAKSGLAGHDHQVKQTLGPLEKKLLESAPRAIDSFVGEIEESIGRRGRETVQTTATKKREFFGRFITTEFRSELASRGRQFVACREAQRKAEALKLQALDTEALTAALAELRASIPMTIEMEQVL